MFTRPWSDGTTGIKLLPLELLEKLAAIAPLPRAHLVRYGGCLAPHSTLRAAIIPTPRQQGVDGEEAKTGTPYWHWARLLGRVFHLDMATCLPPLCGRREARRHAAPTQSRQALRPSLVSPGLAPDHCRYGAVTILSNEMSTRFDAAWMACIAVLLPLPFGPTISVKRLKGSIVSRNTLKF